MSYFLRLFTLLWAPQVVAQVVSPSFCGNQSMEGFQTLEQNGATREYILYVPSTVPDDSKLPLLINFHGYGDCAKDYAETIGELYGLNDLAAEAGFLVAYPQAMVREKGDPYWEPGDIGSNIEVNDVMFTRAIVSDVAAATSIDIIKTYAIGYSNGGMMAYDLACTAADLIDSVTIMSGVRLEGVCDDSVTTSILHFHGSSDNVIPLDGSGDFPSVYNSIDFWVEQNQIPETSLVSSSLNSGEVIRDIYVGGREETKVALYVINSEFDKPAGHSWFSDQIEGKTPNQIMWDFFSGSANTRLALEASIVELDKTTFRQDEGDNVVLAFDIVGDIAARIDGLSIEALGELDEIQDVGLVKVHLDENKNLVADSTELLGQSTYAVNDGVINFEFANPIFTQGDTTRILITYEL